MFIVQFVVTEKKKIAKIVNFCNIYNFVAKKKFELRILP